MNIHKKCVLGKPFKPPALARILLLLFFVVA